MDVIQVQAVDEDLFLIRVNDYTIRYFEGLWEIPEGITYNAYVLKTDKGAVLFDTVKANYAEEYLQALFKIVDPAEIHHLVIHHMEPDHSGAIPHLFKALPHPPSVWGHPFTKRLLEGLYGLTPEFHAIKDGTTLEIGGQRLVFYQTPWLHWPETMVTHMPDRGYLLTGDIFGGFGIPDTVFDEPASVKAMLPLSRKYFATVVGHYKEYVPKNFRKLETLQPAPQVILPAHGLLWRHHPEQIYQAYRDWALGTPTPTKVVVAYTSMYGHVERAIQVAIDALKGHGMNVEVFRWVDTHHDALAEFIGALPDAQAVVLGTATYESDVYPIMRHVVDEMVHKAAYAKPVLILSAHGWAGVVGRVLKHVFSDSPYELIGIVEFRGHLTEKDEKAIQEHINRLVTWRAD